MKLVNESLKNLKLVIGKDIVTVGEDGSLEIDGKDKDVLHSLLNSGFEEVTSTKSTAKKTVAAPKADVVVDEEEETEEPKAETPTKEPKSLGEKVRNRFKKD